MLNINLIQKDILIWGTGIEALRFLFCNQLQCKIIGFVDNRADVSDFLGLPVSKAEDIEFMECYVVFCGSEATYYSYIQEYLKERGLIEFENFAFYDFFSKKIVYMHGNCHMDSIIKALNSSENFRKAYIIYWSKRICDFKKNEEVSDNTLKNIDYFIHQDIREENGYGVKLSDCYLVPKISDKCINITIPNLYRMGAIYFPQITIANGNNYHVLAGRDANGMFPHADDFIENELRQGADTSEIIHKASNDALFSDSLMLGVFNETISKLKARELNWDIKISDFILENYKKAKLFYDIGHPTEIIILYICRKLLEILKVDDDINENDKFLPMDQHETPIYPCVKRFFNLEFEEIYIRRSDIGKRLSPEMDIAEYIREYIQWRNISLELKEI